MTLIRNARWLDGKGCFHDGWIRFREGRLWLSDSGFPPPPSEDEAIDGTGFLTLPGLADAHVHLRQPGQASKEGVANGTRAALAGGVTTVLDMPNNRPPCTTPARLEGKRRLFRKESLTNWGLHLGAPVSAPPSLSGIWRKCASLKVFLARSGDLQAETDPDRLTWLLGRFPVVSLHVEDETVFPAPEAGMPHHLRRPRAAIVQGLKKIEAAVVALERNRGPEALPRLVLLHLSTIEEIAWVRAARARGWDVWAETCPHYLFFTSSDQEREGAGLKVNPPLRDQEDQTALRESLRDGTIDFISTDHAPHLPHEKAGANPPSGMPGIEWMMPLLLHLVEHRVLSWKRFVEVGCTRQAECYSIRGRGALREGNAADLVMVSERSPSEASGRVITRAGYDPFRGIPLRWSVRKVFVNGHPAFQDGVFSPRKAGKEVFDEQG